MSNIDQLIFEKINSLVGRFVWLDNLGVFLAEKLIYFLFFFALFYFLFLWGKDKNKGGQFFIGLIFILSLTTIFNLFLNMFYFRARPYMVYYKIKNLIPFLKRIFPSSFPSWHTSLSFALSFAILLINKKLGWLFLILSFLVGLARIFVGFHWPSDILIGIFIPFISYLSFLFIVKKKI